jgi:hypothetical protein
MAVVTEKAQVVAETLRSPFEKNKLSDGVIDIGGPTLDHLIIHGIRLSEGTSREIRGNPQRSDLNAPDVWEYVAEGVMRQLNAKAQALVDEMEQLDHKKQINELTDEMNATQSENQKARYKDAITKLETAAAEVKPEDKLNITRKYKHLRSMRNGIKGSLQKVAVLTSDAYIFKDVLLLHIGHTEFHLVDYGKVDTQTGQLEVFGFINELPEPIEISPGRKLQFVTFDPIDTREIEHGGMIKTTYLTQEDRIALNFWVRRLMRFTSYIREHQRFITVAKERDALASVVKDLQDSLAAMTRKYTALKGKLGGGQVGSVAAFMLSLAASQIGLGCLGLIIGFVVAISLGSSTTVVQEPVRNQTYPYNPIGTTNVTIQQVNPAVYGVTGIFVLGFIGFSYVLNSKWWRSTPQK